MALITCPECGKEKVSDSAIACPDCGFAIKDYFDKIKEEDERKRNEEAALERIREENKRKAETAPQRQEEAIRNSENRIQLESKQMRKHGIIFSISLVVFLVCLCVDPGGLLYFEIISGIAGFLSLVMLLSAKSDKEEALNDLELAKKSIDQYERNLEKRQEKAVEQLQVLAKNYEAKHPTCPQCGSNHTERISTIGRAASIATLGLASSKIGKQYQCKNCKHKW